MDSAMRRAHHMPFGAQLTAAGVRFRLWAPGAQRVELVLCDPEARHIEAMQALPAGWFESCCRA
jgi:maltooligosyltrehalose trehalohydrolase